MFPKKQLRNELAGVAVLMAAAERVVVGVPAGCRPASRRTPTGAEAVRRRGAAARHEQQAATSRRPLTNTLNRRIAMPSRETSCLAIR